MHNMNKSVVIIGGGLGGLFTGAILAKEGVKVTVIEKNATVGGGLQSFTRFGEVFDTGMHMVGGMQEGGSIRKICEYIGIFDRVPMMPVDRHMMDNIYFAEARRIFVENCQALSHKNRPLTKNPLAFLPLLRYNREKAPALSRPQKGYPDVRNDTDAGSP